MDPYYHPYGVVAYIGGMSHMNKAERESIEQNWKNLNKREISNGRGGILHRIEQGKRIVDQYNRSCEHKEDRIFFVELLKKTSKT